MHKKASADLELPDEATSHLRQRRPHVPQVGGRRHEVRHLDVVGVLRQLVHCHDERRDAHPEPDELHPLLPRLLHDEVLAKGFPS